MICQSMLPSTNLMLSFQFIWPITGDFLYFYFAVVQGLLLFFNLPFQLSVWFNQNILSVLSNIWLITKLEIWYNFFTCDQSVCCACSRWTKAAVVQELSSAPRSSSELCTVKNREAQTVEVKEKSSKSTAGSEGGFKMLHLYVFNFYLLCILK